MASKAFLVVSLMMTVPLLSLKLRPDPKKAFRKKTLWAAKINLWAFNVTISVPSTISNDISVGISESLSRRLFMPLDFGEKRVICHVCQKCLKWETLKCVKYNWKTLRWNWPGQYWAKSEQTWIHGKKIRNRSYAAIFLNCAKKCCISWQYLLIVNTKHLEQYLYWVPPLSNFVIGRMVCRK